MARGFHESKPAGSQIGDAESIRAELDRVLRSPYFATADNLCRFLRYVVDMALQGRQDDLKEYVIGVEVFGRGESFDPKADSIVRVEARKIRAKLDEYYRNEGREDPVRIDLPKGGYVPVLRKDPESPQQISLPSPTRKWIWPAVAAAALLIVVSAAISFRIQGRAAPARAVESIAVLPFTNLSPNTDDEYFSDGLTAELIAALARRGRPRVIGATSVFQFKGKARDLRRTGAELGVEAIVEGSVRKSGEHLRIIASLVEVSSGLQLWTQAYDREWKDVLTVQEEISRDIASALQVELVGVSQPTPNRCAENLEAYELYMRARLGELGRGAEDLTRSLEYLTAAARLEPHCAPVYALLGRIYVLQGMYGVRPPGEVMPKAMAAARHAMEIDESLAAGHTVMGAALALYDWNWDAAEREFRRAILLDRAYPEARHWLSIYVLAPQRRFDEALEEIRQAKWLDPVSPVIGNTELAILYFAGQYETAITQARRTLARQPDSWQTYHYMAWSFEQKRMFADAREALLNAIRLSNGNLLPNLELAVLDAMSGQQAGARRQIREYDMKAKSSYVAPAAYAHIYAVLGDREETFLWLSRAQDEHSPMLVFAGVAHDFDNVKDDQRFTALLRAVGIGR